MAASRTDRTPKKERLRLERERQEREERERAAHMTIFLEAFRESANVRAAATAAGIARSTAYAWRDTYPTFASAWDEAESDAVDTLEQEAWRRARDGVTKQHGVYFKDELLETIEETEYSDTLLIFLMKAHRPQKYRETIRTEIVDVDMSKLSDDELRAIAAGQTSRRR